MGVRRERFSFNLPEWPRMLRWWKAKPMAVSYSELPHFAKYDLENGFLLDMKEGDSVELTVEAALTYARPLCQRTLWAKVLDVLIRDLPPYQQTPHWVKILIVSRAAIGSHPPKSRRSSRWRGGHCVSHPNRIASAERVYDVCAFYDLGGGTQLAHPRFHLWANSPGPTDRR